jgi:uncharacterized membrane protein (TIGR02234 family)
MIERHSSKRTVLVLVLVSASLILVSGSREWVSGSIGDAALGATVLHGKGSEVAPGALAAALVGLASAVAATTAGPVVRLIAAASALLAAVLGAGVAISVLVDPDGALGELAAAGTGRTGVVIGHGQAGSWAWVALAATLVMGGPPCWGGGGGGAALVGSRRWDGLSSRYDAPVPGQTSPPDEGPHAGVEKPRGRESDWDQISRGEDPTVEKSSR